MRIPLLDLKAQYASIRDEIRPAIERVIESQSFILGPEVEAFEHEIAAYCGVRYAVGVSSGTDGLLAALMALDIKPGDEVVTTPFSFFATAGVIARLQAVPVFIDIDPVTFNLEPELLEAAIKPRTKAILPVHLFGQCADMDPILAIAREHSIPVVEDACQAVGAEYKGRRSGSLGDLGVFSFFPSKNLGGFGDGGMVVTNDASLYEKLVLLRQHGSAKTYHHKIVGGNFRLDALQASVLRIKLRYLDDWSAARRANAEFYSRRLSESGLLTRSALRIPVPVREKEGDFHNHVYNQYTLRVMKRDELRESLRIAGIETSIYYPVPLHLQPCFVGLGYKEGDLLEAEKTSGEVLSIPVYPELTVEQKEYIIGKIIDFYNDRKA